MSDLVEGSGLALALGLLAAALRLATPLLIAALGELVAERSGVLNIGIEGMMLGGALVAYLVGAASGQTALAVLAGILAGAALAAVFAVFAIERRADPIVCGTALNILALGLTGSVHRMAVSTEIVRAPVLPEWLPGVHPFQVLALLLLIGVGAGLERTRTGLWIRASGEGAQAAHAQGIPVQRLRWLCTLLGGALAGLAGATLVLWISDTFVEGMTGGRGFIALALVLFGSYAPWRIAAGALLFGFASALQFRLQALGIRISYNLLLMLPYLLTLAVLAVFARRRTPPADLGRPLAG
jgi:general nucleoside transport system permease protein